MCDAEYDMVRMTPDIWTQDDARNAERRRLQVTTKEKIQDDLYEIIEQFYLSKNIATTLKRIAPKLCKIKKRITYLNKIHDLSIDQCITNILGNNDEE